MGTIYNVTMKNITRQEIDTKMSQRLIKLSKKYPNICADYLHEMHMAIDWAEKQLRLIKK